MATFDFTHLHGLTQIKALFPELTEKQFRLTFSWVLGTEVIDIARDSDCTTEAVKKTLQRSKLALGAERLEAVRSIFLCRLIADLWGRQIALAKTA
ncbi:hypothetical protein DCF83_18015 (plasmid) [Edwardsiella tarda]|uniref:hypothetical protein n=1 Tax=Edwardsiella tarda TaxID=636 RepID=UPI000D517280|nr:hypothetical protein [Edwardsiella tarda]UCQ29615.1 hypothetical protein DCF83_18015 [Edwardsiella tarda]